MSTSRQKIGRFFSELSLGSLAGHAKSVVRDGRAANGQSMVSLLGTSWDWVGMAWDGLMDHRTTWGYLTEKFSGDFSSR